MEDIEEKDSYTVNSDFDTDFDVTEEKPILGIHNNGRVNRPLATQDKIGNTSFSAILNQVHYGTYENKPACLISLDFSFRFRAMSLCRHNYAEIEVEFEKTIDPQNPKVRCRSPMLDPKVVNMAPKEVYGIAKTDGERKYWDVSIPIMFKSPIGASAGITGNAETGKIVGEDNYMAIYGELSQDDDHDEGANGVTWDLTENQAQNNGIFRHFRAAIIVQHRPNEAFWMRVSVKPSVKFSLDPQRLSQKGDFLHKLLQRNDDPILLDGITPKGSDDLDCDDFSSENFPWGKVLTIPEECK